MENGGTFLYLSDGGQWAHVKYLEMLEDPVLLKCSLVDYHDGVMKVSKKSYVCDEIFWAQVFHETSAFYCPPCLGFVFFFFYQLGWPWSLPCFFWFLWRPQLIEGGLFPSNHLCSSAFIPPPFLDFRLACLLVQITVSPHQGSWTRWER